MTHVIPARVRLSPVRLTGLLLATLVAVGVAGCGSLSDPHRQNIVPGSFNGGRLIALNEWVGTNSVGSNLEAYAELPDQTSAVLDVSGPEHWRCSGVLRTHAKVASGTFLESDADRLKDQILNLPSFALDGAADPGVGFSGPAGTYRVTIEVPSLSVKYSHNWKLGGGGWNRITMAYDNPPACQQVADTAAQQRTIGDRYISALQRVLTGLTPSGARTDLQARLDQAKLAKASGDGRADTAARAADYRGAADILGTMVQSARASGDPGLHPTDIYRITTVATNAAAILSEVGLS